MHSSFANFMSPKEKRHVRESEFFRMVNFLNLFISEIKATMQELG
jgi:hypothetical protein